MNMRFKIIQSCNLYNIVVNYSTCQWPYFQSSVTSLLGRTTYICSLHVYRRPSILLLSFISSDLISQTAERPHPPPPPPSKVYNWLWTLGPRTRTKNWYTHISLTLPIFYRGWAGGGGGVKSAKFGLDFRGRSHLRCSGFKTELYILEIQKNGSADDLSVQKSNNADEKLMQLSRRVLSWTLEVITAALS